MKYLKEAFEQSYFVVTSYNPTKKTWAFLVDYPQAIYFNTNLRNAQRFEDLKTAKKRMRASNRSKRCSHRKYFKVIQVTRKLLDKTEGHS